MRERIVLDVQAVSRHFGGLKAVDKLSFGVREHEGALLAHADLATTAANRGSVASDTLCSSVYAATLRASDSFRSAMRCSLVNSSSNLSGTIPACRSQHSSTHR